MSTIPKGTETVKVLVKRGYVLAQRLEADERLKDLGPQVRSAADRLDQADAAAEAAHREVSLRQDLHDQAGEKARGTMRCAELEVRANGLGKKDTVLYQALFPDGVVGISQGSQAAQKTRLSALAEALAADPATKARSETLQAALAAWDKADADLAAARVARMVAIQNRKQAREAFLAQYRAAFGFATGRLGDTKAARAVFPDLGHAAGAVAGDGTGAATTVQAA